MNSRRGIANCNIIPDVTMDFCLLPQIIHSIIFIIINIQHQYIISCNPLVHYLFIIITWIGMFVFPFKKPIDADK